MDLNEAISSARESITVKRVYGEPYERNGVMVIPAAEVMGGGGMGTGDQPDGSSGGGGGFGLRARPVGVYVVRDDEVKWEPAFDLNRVSMGGLLVALAALFVVRSVARRRG
jgi:uncharacterized spore protein YtfJ